MILYMKIFLGGKDMIELLSGYPEYLAQEIAKTIPKRPFDENKRDLILLDLVDGIYDKYKHTGNKDIDKVVELLEKYDTQPDPDLCYDDMAKYGYTWKGMMPVGFEIAKDNPFRVYKLYPNNQEKEAYNPRSKKRNREEDIANMKDWVNKGGMLGIARDERIQYVARTVENQLEFEKLIKKNNETEKDR